MFVFLKCSAFVLSISLLLGGMLGCGRAGSTAQRLKAAPAEAVLEQAEFNTEEYRSVPENEFLRVLSHPQSTFAIDVDSASYSNVRRFLNEGKLPPSGAVRIEELVNYFDYDYREPSSEVPFSVSTEVASCPWSPGHQLLRVALKGRAVDLGSQPPCNLVFLLDVSGSMQAPNKLPLVKSAMSLLVAELQPTDRIAVVLYAGDSGLALESTPIRNGSHILSTIHDLRANGATHGSAGIQLAYEVAQENFVEGGVNRVILCTDGDFNVGQTDDSQLESLIQESARSHVFLSVLGFGTGNLKDSKMEMLADKGNGSYAYIDSILEAKRVLVDQIGGTLLTIAKDVKIQVDFNPQHIESYRLMGYENRILAAEHFRDDSKDAGELGAGHTVTAFYEIVPADPSQAKDVETSEAVSRTPEFVSRTVANEADDQTRLTVNLRYKLPSESTAQEFQVRVPAQQEAGIASPDFQFATSVLGFGMLLRQSRFADEVSWDWVVQTAEEHSGPDPRGLRAEFVQLAKKAQALSQ